MTWQTILIIVGCIWITGWLVFSAFIFAKVAPFERRRGKDEPQHVRTVAGFYLVMSFFLWPVLSLQMLGEYAPRLGVKLGIRPAWSVETEGEEPSHTWRLKDGTEFWASVLGFSSYVAAYIEVQGPLDNVAYQVRKLAPEQLPATEWQVMQRPPPEEMVENAEHKRNGKENQDTKPSFLAEPKLNSGKYLISFRVRNSLGESEEFSGLILIVR